MTGIMILVMHNTRRVSRIADRARPKFQVTVRSVGKAAQGPVWLRTLRGTLGYYVTIEGKFGDFGITNCDNLDSGMV